uniref:Aminotransferase-like plant mobile domain-containing protein n=1 Tax=Oryza meridionalis TaxID=40149 RepID=A0A0E0DZH9_9ORYZ
MEYQTPELLNRGLDRSHRSYLSAVEGAELSTFCPRLSRQLLQIDPRFVERLREAGLIPLCRLVEDLATEKDPSRRWGADQSLLAALVDRWRPETCTFYLPCGEMTPTLQDVSYLLGLPLAGSAIVRRSLEAYLLWLFGWVMFTATEGRAVDKGLIYYARAIVDAEDGSVPQWSWGSAVLAATYRGLCDACTKNNPRAIIAGCPLLLQLWAAERFSIGRPVMDHTPYEGGFRALHGHSAEDRPTMGTLWCRLEVRWGYKDFVMEFDRLQPDDVVWEPYNMIKNSNSIHRTSFNRSEQEINTQWTPRVQKYIDNWVLATEEVIDEPHVAAVTEAYPRHHDQDYFVKFEAARRVIADAEAAIILLDVGTVVTGEEQKMTFSRIRSSMNTIMRVLTYRANVNSVPPHQPQAPVPGGRPSSSTGGPYQQGSTQTATSQHIAPLLKDCHGKRKKPWKDRGFGTRSVVQECGTSLVVLLT